MRGSNFSSDMRYHLSFSLRCLQLRFLGFVLTFLFVLTMTQVGTDLVRLVALIMRFFFDVSLTLGILDSPYRGLSLLVLK